MYGPTHGDVLIPAIECSFREFKRDELLRLLAQQGASRGKLLK
jgi:hypothetical protein